MGEGGRQARLWLRVFSSDEPLCHGVAPAGRVVPWHLPWQVTLSHPNTSAGVPSLPVLQALQVSSGLYNPHIQNFPHTNVFHIPNFLSFLHTKFPSFTHQISRVFHTPGFQFSTHHISNVFHAPTFQSFPHTKSPKFYIHQISSVYHTHLQSFSHPKFPVFHTPNLQCFPPNF